MFRIIISAVLFNSVICLNLCDDWIQYKDSKCFKVLEKKGTEEEAVGNCTQLEQSSTLISIHSKEEQEFLNNILSKYNNISTFSWIGIKYLDNAYKWLDNSPNNYTNWSEDAVIDGSVKCAQMYLSGANSGKWTDENCKKSALIVCQKSQELSLTLLKNIIEKQQSLLEENKANFLKEIESIKATNKINSQNQENLINKQNNENKANLEKLTKVIEKQETEIKGLETQLTTNLIPIGFIYTQLMAQKEPNVLWPQFKWLEVTKDYSGLFFRAEGGESLPFGQIQSQNQSFISDVYFYGVNYDTWHGGHKYSYSTKLKQNEWVNTLTDGDRPDQAVYSLTFFTTNGEVRPKNSAIKIFKRIE